MTDTENRTAETGRVFRVVERIGNHVPHPFLLSWYLLIALGGLTPRFWQHVLPYGEVKLDMTACLSIRTATPPSGP